MSPVRITHFARLTLAGFVLAGACAVGYAQEVPHFPIVRFNVEGNTLLSPAEIDSVTRAFIGPKRDFGDVQQALEALEARFHARGFSTVSVQLPEQVLEKGEVLLKVIEGRLNDVKISGNKFFDEANVQASLPTLKPGIVPRVDDVSANLRIANENPAKKLTLKLIPGESDEAIDAHIGVTDERPWKIGLTLENTGSIQTGRNRLGVSFQHANLWNRDHILTTQYQTSPEKPNDVNVYAIAYRMPLYELGDALDLFVTKSDVNAGTIPAGPVSLAISGRGQTFGMRYTLNLKRAGNYEQSLLFGYDHKAFENDIGAGTIQLGNDITVHPLTLQYNGRWQKESTELSLYGSLSNNLPGGNKGTQADFDRARLGAPDDFQVVRFGMSASHRYANDWQIRFSSSGQWTNDPLIPGEQFGIGGASALRGFEEREVANDKGYQATLEVYTPDLCKGMGSDQRCRLLAFYDMGSVYRVNPLVGEKSGEGVASTGLGLRYDLGNQMTFQADYGYVLQGGGLREAGDWRWHARLGFFF